VAVEVAGGGDGCEGEKAKSAGEQAVQSWLVVHGGCCGRRCSGIWPEAMGSGVEKARRSAASREALVGDVRPLRSGAPLAS
jgi:hypothetical protein